MNESGIYYIRNNANGKYYVGSAVLLVRRKRQHWHLLRQNRHPNSHLQASFNKHGEENFVFEILEHCPPESLETREDLWIAQLETTNPSRGYNKGKATSTNLGRKWPKEMCDKISHTLTGRTQPNRTVEHRTNLSKANLGKSMSAIARLRMSVAKKGVPKPERTSEHRENLSKANKGKLPAGTKFWEVTLPTNEVRLLQGLGQFCKDYGLSSGRICELAQGKLKRPTQKYQGYKVREISEEEYVRRT